jgi:hypothetical protein
MASRMDFDGLQAAALIALISRTMRTIMSTPPNPKGIGERCWLTEPIGLPMKANAGGEAGGLHRPYPSDGGGRVPSKGGRRTSLGLARPSYRSLLGHAHAAGKILADPMGHERTGEAHY